jgi:hypothetical protein
MLPPHRSWSQLCSASWLEFYHVLSIFSADLFVLLYLKFSCGHSVREEDFLAIVLVHQGIKPIQSFRQFFPVHPTYFKQYVSSMHLITVPILLICMLFIAVNFCLSFWCSKFFYSPIDIYFLHAIPVQVLLHSMHSLEDTILGIQSEFPDADSPLMYKLYTQKLLFCIFFNL